MPSSVTKQTPSSSTSSRWSSVEAHDVPKRAPARWPDRWVRVSSSGSAPPRATSVCGRRTWPETTSTGSPHVGRPLSGRAQALGSSPTWSRALGRAGSAFAGLGAAPLVVVAPPGEVPPGEALLGVVSGVVAPLGVVVPDGLVVVLDGAVVPDGLVAPEGLVVPDGASGSEGRAPARSGVLGPDGVSARRPSPPSFCMISPRVATASSATRSTGPPARRPGPAPARARRRPLRP